MPKQLFIALGLLCVGLAMVGIFLPILPTTPLLLVAVACFARSSERLHAWILSNRTFGPLIIHWQESKSMPRRTKFYAIVMILIVGGVSVLFIIDSAELKIAVAVLLLVPLITILRIKSTEHT
jgi:uncharacterized membrane protein YbaN (DUF454 family)